MGSECGLSPIEFTLLGQPNSFIIKFFDRWEPAQLAVFSRSSKNVRRLVRFYIAHRWNITGFVHRYFSDANAALELFDNEEAMLFGPSVCQFFHRCKEIKSSVDLCLHVRSAPVLFKFLQEDGYAFTRKSMGGPTFVETLELRLASLPETKLKSSGERNASETDRAAWGPFDFVRGHWTYFRRVRLHVVRCEPFRHILTMHSTGLMNFIGWKSAVSLFPRSSFVYHRSFVTRQDFLLSDHFPDSHKKWFATFAVKKRINIVGLSTEQYHDVEVGRRFVGDKLSWIIPKNFSDPDAIIEFPDGPSFDVSEWDSGTTRPESYIRISEPEIWRQWSMINYGLGAVFAEAGLDMNIRPTQDEWKATWQRYAVGVVLVLEGAPENDGSPRHKLKFSRIYAAKVENELPTERQALYREGLSARPWPVGLVYKVVSASEELALSLSVMVRSLRPIDVITPGEYVRNMAGLANLLEDL
ncbi:hypothetical protein CVT26_000572 [Gymnopilus dilepis]|uniref:Uncharacterized protein n=1 Tax=Gymnopilus dilepis TaxID=231916 RepID=A0A409VHC1_9AGAR|nr:hypothetical protein CVT26_000572 [Gymnopilus dilepis]